MLVRPFSDLHVEFWPAKSIRRILLIVVPHLPSDKETVALIAGDLGLAHRHDTWLTVLSILAHQFFRIVYVEGNHFFHNNDFFGRVKDLKKKVSIPGNAYLLENESVEIDGVVFIGATLWTDFQGRDPIKMKYAKEDMADFEVIKGPKGNPILPTDTVDAFEASKKYIFKTIEKAKGQKSVVVTHHGISPFSISKGFRGDPLNSAFISDLSQEICARGPNVWVHGHTHDSFDYTIGRTRVIANPYGYRRQALNPAFRKDLLLEV